MHGENFKQVSNQTFSVMSSLDHHLDQMQFLVENSEDLFAFGINGGYNQIPKGLILRNIIVGSTEGINSAMHDW